jgi:hypothetical protein
MDALSCVWPMNDLAPWFGPQAVFGAGINSYLTAILSNGKAGNLCSSFSRLSIKAV